MGNNNCTFSWIIVQLLSAFSDYIDDDWRTEEWGDGIQRYDSAVAWQHTDGIGEQGDGGPGQDRGGQESLMVCSSE